MNSENNLLQSIRKKIEDYQKEVKKDKLKHLKTRRLGAVFFLFGVMGLAILVIEKHIGTGIKIIEGANFVKDTSVGMTLLILNFIFIILMFFACSKRMICFFYCSFFVLSATAMCIFSSEASGYIFSGLSLSLYLCCYGLNRQPGYTKLWARHQRLVTQLELLEWNFKHEIEVGVTDSREMQSQLNFTINNTRTEYLEILKKHAFERQADIVGDYLSTNDAAFSWIKSLKK